MTLPKIAAIQMNSGSDLNENLETAANYIAKAAKKGAKLVVLPEMFVCLSEQLGHWVQYAETYGKGPIQDRLSQLAKQHKIWLIGGTIPLKSDSEVKAYATCLAYDASGQCVARYDKMHLFDVIVEPGNETYLESAFTAPGKQLAVFDSPFGRIGLAVCYDLRFPGLFMQLAQKQCDLIVVPSAFTAKTGIAHWETLLRARALDTFAYVLAANQTGTHPGNRKTFGHSMLVGPWGNILQAMRSDTGIIVGEMDRDIIQDIRERFPTQQHNQFNSIRQTD